MKANKFKQFTLILPLFILFHNISHAQVKDLGSLMAAGAEDAELLLAPYMAPYVNGFGAALAGGWYNTANTHKLGGFDITFTMNIAAVPEKFKTFDLANIELRNLRLNDQNESLTPTIAGAKDAGPQLNYNLSGYNVRAFNMPQGINWRYIPAPMIQAGLGLIKGTEVIGRYMPDIKISDSKIGLWGIGVKHDVKQWIPGLKKLPVLNIALMYGYTKLHTNIGLSVTPEDINAQSLSVDPEYTGNWDNQELNFIARSHTANLLISANLPVVCFYGGVGFISTKTNLSLLGDYPFVSIGTGTPYVGPYVAVINNPLDMTIKNQDGGITKPRYNLGIRFKMAVITIHFDYTRANYNVFTAGFGVSWR
jgi:hypothetical protein